ncbi:MAG: CapA family protein [Geobacteraceae bacterium]|nr:CapA family protein [Geobacteraceae bacterium]NTW78657.1 CapA family protein [Geobacteraceae bacterium]
MKSIITHILLGATLLSQPLCLHAEEIIINAVGDIMLAGRWAPFLRQKGYDHPFNGVRNEMASGDINIANLESPIAEAGQEFSEKRFRFRAEPPVAKAIRAAGFNLVTLANNHSMDFGGDALTETFRHLNNNGIAWAGAGKNLSDARKMALYTIKGKKIAFFGYSLTQPIEFFAGHNRPGTAPGYEELVAADIASARSQTDYVIVSFHWGKEAISTIQPYQRSAAHNAIEAGADVVIGHHPHILQGIERYKNGIIFYSLGNFTFASKSKSADVSAIIRLKLNDSNRIAEILPLDVLHRRVGFQPQLLSGKHAFTVIEKLSRLSRPFNTEIQSKDGKYFLTF